MKINLITLISLAFSVQQAFAEDPSTIIDCPQGSQIQCEKNQCSATFSIVLPSKTISYKAEVEPKVFDAENTGKVDFSVHSSSFEGNTMTCAIQRTQNGKSQFIEFPTSIDEINKALISENYRVQSRHCDQTAKGISCILFKKS